MRCWQLFALLSVISFSLDPSAEAMDSTEVLPAGIHSPALRFGMVSGVDSKYSADGSVQSLNDINTIHFTSDLLFKIDPRVTELANILNQFSQQNLGAQLNLGSMRVETEPNIRYFAPIFARGITHKHTIAAALPIVRYQNKLRLTQSASNVKAICSQISGVNLPELNSACSELDVKVVDAVNREIESKGYRRIEDRNETVIGDLQLLSLWKFYENEAHSTMLRTTLNLPTGANNDPDDLADLGVFGQSYLEPQIIYNWLPWNILRLAVKAGYRFVVPDKVTARVPKDEEDVLPGLETKERVKRDVGDTYLFGAAANLAIWESFTIAGGYELAMKRSDRYMGERVTRYDILSKDSESQAHRLKAGVSYDTIGLYKRKQNFPPLKLDFDVTNTIAGKNTDRQLVNELSLTMFF